MTITEIMNYAMKITGEREILIQREAWKKDGIFIELNLRLNSIYPKNPFGIIQDFSIDDLVADDWTLDCDLRTISNMKNEKERQEKEEEMLRLRKEEEELKENFTGVNFQNILHELLEGKYRRIGRKGWYNWRYIYCRDGKPIIHIYGDGMAGSVDFEQIYYLRTSDDVADWFGEV